MKRLKTLAVGIALCLGIVACGNNTEEIPQIVEEKEETATDELSVHFIDVGQGDATLITCGTEAMLVDAGDNDQGTKVQNYLRKQGIEKLKYVIGTHPDSDHIGGLDVILYKFDCETIILPGEKKETATYQDVIATMENKGYKNMLPVVGDTYALGDAEFTILSPVREYEQSNDNSVAFLLKHGENSFLFTGDAEEEAEKDILNSGLEIAANVYKAGHHGSKTASGKEFLETVSPEYAVISCKEGNSYGHPHAEVLNNLRAMDVSVYRTDEQGSITVTSDGKALTWNCSPSETWKAGEPTALQENNNEILTEPIQDISYVCNTNTMKFHSPMCKSVKDMKDKNKVETSKTREEVISQGYVPCKNCDP